MPSLLHKRMLDNNCWREYYSPIGVMIITETRLRTSSFRKVEKILFPLLSKRSTFFKLKWASTKERKLGEEEKEE